MAIYDFYSDPTGAVLREIAVDGDIPPFVRKSASLIPAEAVRAEHKVFAWKSAAMFPIDTPEDIWLSDRYFAKTAHLIPFQYHDGIRAQIKHAADLFEVNLTGPEVKQASIPDEAYLVVTVIDVTDPLFKRASAENLDDRGDNTYGLKLYPVWDAESLQKAAHYFPRGLEGSLASFRIPLAVKLAELCEEHQMEVPHLVAVDAAPIKKSALINHIAQRVWIINEHNAAATKVASLVKNASDSGRETPYTINKMAHIDVNILLGYQELQKSAYDTPLPAKFWELFDRLDKAAGMDDRPDVTPVVGLDRDVEDDMPSRWVKLAGTLVSTKDIVTKVAADVWQDVAPIILDCLDDTHRLKEAVESLDVHTQRIVFAKIRGY